MKIQWDEWNIGGKIIFTSACVAIISFLFAWVDIGLVSQNGISQGTFLLGALYVYPVLKLLKNQSIERKWGIACGVASIVLTIIYISSKSVSMFGKSINASGSGAFLFLLASIALIIGILKYSRIEISELEEPIPK